MIRAFVAICLFGGVLVQSVPQYCPNWETVQDFDLHKFLGMWYDVAQSTSPSLACRTDEYVSNGTNVFIIRGGERARSNKQFDPNQRLTVRSTSTPGVLQMISSPDAEPVYYMILNTDYVSYAIVYECPNLMGEQGTVYALSREQFPTRDYLITVALIIKHPDSDIEPRKLFFVDQRNCTNSIIW